MSNNKCKEWHKRVKLSLLFIIITLAKLGIAIHESLQTILKPGGSWVGVSFETEKGQTATTQEKRQRIMWATTITYKD